LSYAKTIDTFQGQNAGPVDEGKPPNPVKTIICDPGTREFESRKPGLFYTIVSRATTIGSLQDGKRIGSAVYFFDHGLSRVMTPARIVNLRQSLNTGKLCSAIAKRDKWVNHLRANKLNLNHNDINVTELFQWANNTRVSDAQLHTLLHLKTSWRQVN